MMAEGKPASHARGQLMLSGAYDHRHPYIRKARGFNDDQLEKAMR